MDPACCCGRAGRREGGLLRRPLHEVPVVPGGRASDLEQRMMLRTERLRVCEFARRMTADGLVVGTSGNISVRSGGYVAMTPTGVDYQELMPEHIPVLDTSGSFVDGTLKPTSEPPMHLGVDSDGDAPVGAPVGAVVHTHSVHATAVSTLVTEVPAIHYMLAAIGPTVRVADYASYGTPALAASVRTAIEGRRGC